MNNLSLLTETQALLQPPQPLSYPLQTHQGRLLRGYHLSTSLSLPSTPNQVFLFLGACYKARRLIGAVAG